jgi:hypothetical protein
MNKNILLMIVIAIILIPSVVSARGNTNLLKNSELKVNAKGKVSNWYFKSFYTDKGYKGQNSVRIPLDKQSRTFVQAVMSQYVKNLTSGKYVFSVNIKFDRNIHEALFLRIIKNKPKFRKKIIQPKSGEWTKLIIEFDIPKGINAATIALDLRDVTTGANVWVNSPTLYYKSK